MTPVTVRIQELREAQGWSQSELARRSSLSQSAISRLESGESQGVGFDTLEKLAKALRCDPGYLIVKKP